MQLGIYIFEAVALIALIVTAIALLSAGTKTQQQQKSEYPDIEHYYMLTKRLPGPPWPLEDSFGNQKINTIPMSVAGVTHAQLTGDPQSVLPKLNLGDRLFLVPNPDNPFDDHAIRVMTMRKKQIGWVPKDQPQKENIFDMLTADKDVYADVFKLGSNNGRCWCDMRVMLYADDNS